MAGRNRRKICVVTGTRAEYGLLKSIMTAIRRSEKLSLVTLVTGMHLSPKFGLTLREIIKDGFKIDIRVKMAVGADTAEAMAESIGGGIIGMTRAFKKIKPDVVLVLGDRVESLAAVISAAYSGLVVGHIHGGDSAQAGLDEYARHAITKLSHLHFPATKKSAERIIKMGEDKKRVFVVGAPGLDSILHQKLISPATIAEKFRLDIGRPILLVLQHPVTTEIGEADRQMKETLEALKELAYQVILIYPNADAGGRRIIKVIKHYRKYNFIRVYKNLDHLDYLSLMKAADVLVGNSSSGMIETASFGLPVVNIGVRQEGRERGENVIDVPHKKEAIKRAIKKALKKPRRRYKNPYGQGVAGKKIAKILEQIKIGKNLFQKKITY